MTHIKKISMKTDWGFNVGDLVKDFESKKIAIVLETNIPFDMYKFLGVKVFYGKEKKTCVLSGIWFTVLSSAGGTSEN